MITISVCMIVKNEEKTLKRCLDSLNGLYDELIIVDTGSSDKTREIAQSYTKKVYDFKWVNDFSAARNFSFSKATCDYIYCADADEILDDDNRQKFKFLKMVMLPEVEIVEMKYVNQLENGTVYNFDEEYRPKLYKRLRTFHFIDPIHEMVRLDPIVYDSDIEIIHKPETLHSARDIEAFERITANGEILSERLTRMYALELMLSGNEEHFRKASGYFETLLNNASTSDDTLRLCYIVLAKYSLIISDEAAFEKYSYLDVNLGASSEMCTLLGDYYLEKGNTEEAKAWFSSAMDSTLPEVCLIYHTDIPASRLESL